MERQTSVVLLVLMFLMLQGNFHCASVPCTEFGSVMFLGSYALFIRPLSKFRQIQCQQLHRILKPNWIIFTNLMSGTEYECSVDNSKCNFVTPNHATTTQDITGVVASVFHPLHNNTDLTTAQISWRLANSSPSPLSYDVRIRCIEVSTNQRPSASLEHIRGSPFHTNTSRTHFNLVNVIRGNAIPRLPPRTYCVVDVKMSDSTIWSEPHVFSTQASITPHNETVVIVDSYMDCSDEEENAVLVLGGQDIHEYTCIEAAVGGVALDNKNRVVFAVNTTHVIKMARPLSVDMKVIEYSLLKELTPLPSIAYDWLSEMLYVSGWLQESVDDDGDFEFVIMRKLVTDGIQGDFEIIFNHTYETVEDHQLTVNPLSGMMHLFVQDSNEIHRLQINPRISSSSETLPLFQNFTSFTEDVVNNCIILANRVGHVYRLESGENVLKLGTCSGRRVNTTMLSLTTNGHLRKISLDELGIYYVSELHAPNLGHISMDHKYAVNYQTKSRSRLGRFEDAVSFILSTSPGMQPYPEDLDCLVGESRTIKLINSTEHSMYIVWYMSPSNNIECLNVSRPKLTYQVTISAQSANIQMLSLSSAHISGLQPGTDYTVSVIGESINVRLQWQRQSFRTVCRNGSCDDDSISTPESSSVVEDIPFTSTMAAIFSPSSLSLTQAIPTPSSTLSRPQGERLPTSVVIIIASTVVFVGFILTVVVTAFIVITATCLLYKRWKKTNKAVCTLYNQTEPVVYDTPRYDARSDVCGISNAAPYEVPLQLQRASINRLPPHLNVSSFRAVSPAIYDEPFGLQNPSNYEVAVRTRDGYVNDLYTSLDDLSDQMNNRLKQEGYPPKTHGPDNEYSVLMQQASCLSNCPPSKPSQKDPPIYFSLEKSRDEPTDSFQIDQGSEAFPQCAKVEENMREGEEKESREEGEEESGKEKMEANIPTQDGFNRQSEDHTYSETNKQGVQSETQPVKPNSLHETTDSHIDSNKME